jgi:membrane protease subunit HflK
MYTVSEQEQAVITQFGKAYTRTDAGLHFRIPIVQQVHKVNMTTRGMELGYMSQGLHSEINVNVETESFMITKDFNFVTIDFYVEWRVSDATKFLFKSNDPEGLLRNILQSEARSIVSSFNVDDILTTAKPEIQSKMKEAVLEKLEYYDLGLTITNISIQDAQPPTDYVVAAFKNVENSKQTKETDINIANTYSNGVIH